MKQVIILILCVFGLFARAQNADTLIVNYFENYPYVYSENGNLQGIEVDILNEYVTWLKAKKNFQVAVVFKKYSDFDGLYQSVKGSRPNVIGLGSVARNDAREKELRFSAPYLHNVSVMISSGALATMREKTSAEFNRVLTSKKAYCVKGSSHFGYLTALKSTFMPQLAITTVDNQQHVLENVISDAQSVGYVDLVAYWAYIKSKPGKFIKMQKVFAAPKEDLCFVSALDSKYMQSLNEFFESGFGFTSTKAYRAILEKYLGFEIIESVEIK